MPIDPELSRQLDQAKTSGDAVSAVMGIKRTAGTKPDPAVIKQHAQSAISRATEATGEEPEDVRVMGHMATAYVSGSAAYISELMAQPEIASAVANQVAPAGRAAEAEERRSTSTDSGVDPGDPRSTVSERPHPGLSTSPDEGGASHHHTDISLPAEGGAVGQENQG